MAGKVGDVRPEGNPRGRIREPGDLPGATETIPVGCDGKGERIMIADTAATTIGARTDFNLATVLFVAFFGVALLFSAGFAQPSIMHDVAHDTRHATGFPCH